MLKLAILGIIQGITEFLPISSSGHLVITQRLFSQMHNAVYTDVMLHSGTILAILTFFFKDIIKAFRDKQLLINILLASLVTGIIGVTFKDHLESLFSSKYIFLAFLINGLMLISTKFFKEGKRRISKKDSLIMGFSQAIAIIPGISRSGTTITTLLLRGADKEEAFKFSFIASIPVILGAFFLELKSVQTATVPIKNIITGISAAYFFGLLALWLLMKTVKKKELHLFGYYCIVIAFFAFFVCFWSNPH